MFDASPDALVALDANFAQRRRHSVHSDPDITHPDSYFISKAQVDAMEAKVEAIRPRKAHVNTAG